MIIIFSERIVFRCVSNYIQNIEKYLTDLNIDARIVIYNNPNYIYKYIVDNNIKNSFILYVQLFLSSSPLEYNNKEFVINIEQMKTLEYRKHFNIENLANNINSTIDYNQININNVLSINSKKEIYYIPYLYCVDNIILENNYDVCIVGSSSPHRINMYNKLKENNINVVYVNNTYGDECERYIGESKILLNIHYIPESDILETFRCYSALYKKKVVISENSVYDCNNELDNLIIYSHYDDLINTVISTLSNYEKIKKSIDNFNFKKIYFDHREQIKSFLNDSGYYTLQSNN